MPCLDEAAALALAAGRVAPEALPALLDHVDGCEACRLLVAEAARGDDAPVAVTAGPPRQLGRFTVDGVAGAGAMGVVYRGHDPRLDRPVALKVIRHAALTEAGRARFEREARALARIAHPHVIAIYEVGDGGDATYIAMEYATGGTLAAWLAAAPRPTAAIVAAFREAAEGLAAAHQAGLVHRDVKPSNLLRDEHGRVKVSDFGLAYAGEAGGGGDDGAGGAADGGDPRLTRTGTALGTPAYMSPEQHAGAVIGPRADQFSLCVALYEAVAGHRPFAGDDLAALAAAVAQPPRAPRRPMPRTLWRTLRRGLARLPEDRFASMRDLIDALTPARRGRWIAAAAIAVAVAGGAVAVARTGDGDGGPGDGDRCAAAPARWRALVAGAALGPDAAAAVADFGVAWQARYRATCGGDASAEARGLQQLCLDDAAARIGAGLAATTPALVADATEQLDRCAAQVLPAGAPPTGAAAVEVAAARDALAQAAAARDRDDLPAATAAVERALARADASAYDPVRAEAWLERAGLARVASRSDDAIAALVQALGFAQASNHHRVLRETADGLAWLYFFDRRDPAQGRHWLDVARTLDARVAPTRYEQAMRAVLAAHLREQGGDRDGALAELAAVADRIHAEQIRGDLGPRAVEGAALMLYRAGRFDEVGAWLDRLERDFGASRLGAYTAARHRGHLAGFQGRRADAVAALERALALGPPASRAADLLALASALDQAGDPAAALARLDQATGPDASAITREEASCLRGRIEQGRRAWAAAEPALRECLRRREPRLGADAPVVIFTLVALGQVLAAEGRRELAIDYYERAVERFAAIGRDDATVAAVRAQLARLRR